MCLLYEAADDELDNGVFGNLVVDDLGRWIPISVDRPRHDRFHHDACGHDGVGDWAEELSSNPTVEVCGETVDEGPACPREPNGTEVRVELRRAIHQLDGPPIAMQRAVDLADDRGELGAGIRDASATERCQERG